jgi:hypothetical protein
MKTLLVLLFPLALSFAVRLDIGNADPLPAFHPGQQGPPNAPPPSGPPSEPVLLHAARPPLPGDFQGKPESITPHKRFDAARTREDAHQLATLASKIPAQVDQVSKGVLPKDLAQQLKQIEKLAKHLRSEITP